MQSNANVDDVRDMLRRFISEIGKIPAERISEHATIDNELQLQSLSFVELQVAIEEFYDVQIDPIAVVELNAFGAIADYIQSLINEAP
jgi:acyl carrier protein